MINQRLLTRITITLLIVGSLSALLVYSVQPFLKSKILAIVQQETGRKASLANVQFAFLPLSVQLQDFALQETDGTPFASVDSGYIQVNILQSLAQSAVVIEKLALVKPVVRIAKQKNGTFNFDSLFNSKTDNQQNTVFPVTIAHLSLSAGQVAWEDGFVKETVQPINLTMENFSIVADKQWQFTLQLALESGGQVEWQGEASLNPLQSKGHITLNNIKLERLLAAIFPEPIGFSLTGYELFDGDYQLRYDDQHFTLTADKTKLALHDFQYAEKNKHPVVAKATDFSVESDIKITNVDDTWLFTGKHSEIDLNNFEFSQSVPTENHIKIPKLNHQAEFKISYGQKNWQFLINNSNTAAHAVELTYLNTALKIPAISVASSFDIVTDNHNVQFIAKQSKLISHDMQLFEKNQPKPLVDMPSLAVNDINFNLNKQSLSIDSIIADGADFRTWLNSDGQFNYQTLFTEPKIQTTATHPAVEAKTPPWTINIKHIDLTRFATTFEDKSLPKPVMMTLKPVNFKLDGYTNKAGVKLPFQLDVGVNNTGTIEVNGDATFEPFVSHLAINAKTINLEPFQSYLEKIAHLDIIEGQLTLNGKLAMVMSDTKPLDLLFTGDSNINQFITRDQKRHKDFITWKNLSLKGVAVDLQKDSYTADALIIDKPYARVIIRKDKTINFSDIFITAPEPNSVLVKTVANVQQPYFKLNKIQVIDGSSDFSDNSLIMPFSAQVKSLDGGASDISSEKKSTIKVSLKGNAYDFSPVDIDGSISPYLGDYDLNLNFKGMPMPLMSPYLVEFAGYKVEKGKMSLGLKYKVVKDELTASNNILIDQFELGEKVDNPNAVSLPLELAVALLKDSDGKIKIDVPITGNLNAPQFDIGAIIADALANTLSKVISSPFRALASLADSDEDLSTITFSAGSAVLNKAQYVKLTALAKELKEHSVLALSIKGTAFEKQDWSAMREAALYDQLKTMRAEEINRDSDKKILPEYIELSDTDYKRLLAQLFIEKFPKLAKKSLFGTPELIDAKSGDFYEVAKQQLSISLSREQSRLKKLAGQRARAIASYLVQQGVPNAQVFILDTLIDPKRDDNEIASLLSLKTN
jgi:outer membrane protein OmpA-like peptidoglycan-associated protein